MSALDPLYSEEVLENKQMKGPCPPSAAVKWMMDIERNCSAMFGAMFSS